MKYSSISRQTQPESATLSDVTHFILLNQFGFRAVQPSPKCTVPLNVTSYHWKIYGKVYCSFIFSNHSNLTTYNNLYNTLNFKRSKVQGFYLQLTSCWTKDHKFLHSHIEVCKYSIQGGLAVLYCSWKKCDQWGFFCQSTGLQVDSKLNELLRHFFRFSSKTVSGSRFSKKKERKRPNLKWCDVKYISSTVQCSFLFNPISPGKIQYKTGLNFFQI